MEKSYPDKCLELLLSRYPQFEKNIEWENSDYFIWRAGLAWPNGWKAVGLEASVRRPRPPEYIFRVDFGNWDQEFGDWDKTGTFDFLEAAFDLIDDFLSERKVLLAIWRNPEYSTSRIIAPDYEPVERDWEHGVSKIGRRSWLGTHDKDWESKV